MTLGELLRKARHDLGLTQAVVAQQLGVHVITYSEYETGQEDNPRLSILRNLSRVLRASPAALLATVRPEK